MPKCLGLTSPLYEIPFDDDTLLILGRIAVLWGQVVFHLDTLLKHLKGMSDAEATRYETRSLKTKLADLTTELSKPHNQRDRRVLRKVHQSIDEVSSDRNVVFHGLWGVYLPIDMAGWRVAAKSWSRERPFFADDLKALHERMIKAADALDDAWYALELAAGPQPSHRNRRQFWIPKGTIQMPPEPPRVPR
jgi:hypothetical protein